MKDSTNNSILEQTYNYLTIKTLPYYVKKKDGKNHSTVDCECRCGKRHTVELTRLKSGATKSCGCLTKEKSSESAKLRRKYEEGATDHPLYRVWQSMNDLCRKENIEIQEDWINYTKFFDSVIKDYVKGLCFSRIDNNLGFTSENCKFMDYKELTSKNDYNQIWENVKTTNLEKYGTEFPQKLDSIKEKVANTNIVKYGGAGPTCSDIVKQKGYNTNIEKYGTKFPMQNHEIKTKSAQGNIDNGRTKIYYDKTISEWAEEKGQNYSTLVGRIAKYGFDIAIKMESNETDIEAIIRLFLEQEDIIFKQELTIKDENNHRRADFLLPDFNLIIEADGLHWHSENGFRCSKDNKYHKEKFDLYTSKGYESLFFYEDEIERQLPIVKHIIKQSCQAKTELVDGYEIRNGFSDWLNQRHLKNSSLEIDQSKILEIIKDGQILAQVEYKIDDGVWIDRFSQEAPYSNLLFILMWSLKNYGDVCVWRDNRTDKFDLPWEPIQNHVDYDWVRDDRRFDKWSMTEQEALESRCSRIWDCGSDLFKL